MLRKHDAEGETVGMMERDGAHNILHGKPFPDKKNLLQKKFLCMSDLLPLTCCPGAFQEETCLAVSHTGKSAGQGSECRRGRYAVKVSRMRVFGNIKKRCQRMHGGALPVKGTGEIAQGKMQKIAGVHKRMLAAMRLLPHGAEKGLKARQNMYGREGHGLPLAGYAHASFIERTFLGADKRMSVAFTYLVVKP